MNGTKTYICDGAGRLDIFLASQIGQSRSQIAHLIQKESVLVDGKVVPRAGVKLKENQIIQVNFPDVEAKPALEIDFDVSILYEDEDVLVINKPSGLTVHPAPSVKEATLVEWLKHKGIRLSTLSGEERYGIVHRLDKGTSGAMVVAKNNASHEFLSNQLQDKSMGRYYLAVVNPPLREDLTEVESHIARSTHNRLKMACLEHGKYAKTFFRALALSDDAKNQLIACKLFTGRTHQIRVHLEKLGRHIVGDSIYAQSPKQEKSERILLHAYVIYFIHPKSKERVSFVAPMDEQMREYLNKKFNMEQIDEIMDVNNIVCSFATNS